MHDPVSTAPTVTNAPTFTNAPVITINLPPSPGDGGPGLFLAFCALLLTLAGVALAVLAVPK